MAAIAAINPLTPGTEVLQRIKSRCLLIWDVDHRLQLDKGAHGARYFKKLLGPSLGRMLRWRSSECGLGPFLGQLEFQRELLQLMGSRWGG